MPYHIRITPRSSREHDEIRLDLTEQQLEERFLLSYREGRPIVIGGRTIPTNDIERIRINYTDETSSQLIPIIRKERLASHLGIPISDEWYVTDRGTDVTDDFITGPPGIEEYIEDKLPLSGKPLSKISTQMDQQNEQNMGNIEIKNSKNVQVNIGKDNYQAQDSYSPNKISSKKSGMDILNSSASVAAFIGFLAVEIGTYFYHIYYNHLISVIVAAISFTIVALLNRR